MMRKIPGAWNPWLAACAAAGLVAVGSFLHGTSRTWNAGNPDGWTVHEEGALRWAVWTFPLGLLALGLLVLARRLALSGRPRVGALAAVPAAAALGLAARFVGTRWLAVLDEREAERDYVLRIAPGLPIVAAAGAVGALAALLTAFAWLRRSPRKSRCTGPVA